MAGGRITRDAEFIRNGLTPQPKAKTRSRGRRDLRQRDALKARLTEPQHTGTGQRALGMVHHGEKGRTDKSGHRLRQRRRRLRRCLGLQVIPPRRTRVPDEPTSVSLVEARMRFARRTAVHNPPSSSTKPRSSASSPVQTRPRATASTAATVILRGRHPFDEVPVEQVRLRLHERVLLGVNGAFIDHASALALVRNESDPTPSRS